MAALSERKTEIVRTLVETAPDRIVAGLQAALAQIGEDTALGSVRRLVDAEARDRQLRNSVLQPIVPICIGDGKDETRLVFPARVLAHLWRGLKAIAPDQVEKASMALLAYVPDQAMEEEEDDPYGDFLLTEAPTNRAADDWQYEWSDEPPPSTDAGEPFDTLVRLASMALRSRQSPDFVQAADACDHARAGGAALLAMCLDLSPVVRRSIPKLPDWMSHFDEETSASARVAYRDAVAIAADGGRPFYEMVAAHLPHPWMVLRIISVVMDRPTERYLADTELGEFCVRTIREIEEALRVVSKLDPTAGPAAGRAAAKEVDLITQMIKEVESGINLSREHGWGHEIIKNRKNLASLVEGIFRSTEKFTVVALPMNPPSRLARVRRAMPNLSHMPDPLAVRRATTLLTFSHDVRSSANHGGFASARNRMIEKLGDLVDTYVEEVVDLLRTGDVEDEGVAYAYLEVAAEVSALLRDEKAAELVRRRSTTVRNERNRQASGNQAS